MVYYKVYLIYFHTFFCKSKAFISYMQIFTKNLCAFKKILNYSITFTISLFTLRHRVMSLAVFTMGSLFSHFLAETSKIMSFARIIYKVGFIDPQARLRASNLFILINFGAKVQKKKQMFFYLK